VSSVVDGGVVREKWCWSTLGNALGKLKLGKQLLGDANEKLRRHLFLRDKYFLFSTHCPSNGRSSGRVDGHWNF
jgi:hypothetical protein